MMFLKCLVAVLLLAVTKLLLPESGSGQQIEKPKWNDLWVTYRKFDKLPTTVQEAKQLGWTKTASCNDNNYFAGDRYVWNGDITVMLLFGIDGKVAGIQMGVPKSVGIKASKHMWVPEGDMFVVTAYFRDPWTICSCPSGKDSFGDKLLILNGLKGTLMEVPYKEEDLKETKWVLGKCFPTMGTHYWYNIASDMDCSDFFPFFVIYDNKRISCFGFNALGDLNSPRLEHPPKRALKLFYREETLPQCLVNEPEKLNTMHVYVTNPLKIACPKPVKNKE